LNFQLVRGYFVHADEAQQAETRNETMKVTIKGSVLTIEIDMQEPTPSASGKTLVVASSHGNQATTATVKGKPLVVGLNAYIRAA